MPSFLPVQAQMQYRPQCAPEALLCPKLTRLQQNLCSPVSAREAVQKRNQNPSLFRSCNKLRSPNFFLHSYRKRINKNWPYKNDNQQELRSSSSQLIDEGGVRGVQIGSHNTHLSNESPEQENTRSINTCNTKMLDIIPNSKYTIHRKIYSSATSKCWKLEN